MNLPVFISPLLELQVWATTSGFCSTGDWMDSAFYTYQASTTNRAPFSRPLAQFYFFF